MASVVPFWLRSRLGLSVSSRTALGRTSGIAHSTAITPRYLSYREPRSVASARLKSVLDKAHHLVYRVTQLYVCKRGVVSILGVMD